MTLRIHRQFIATVAAAAIAITGFTAAPARAGEDEVGAALAALLGLAIVGAVIKDKRDDRKARQQVHTPHHVTPAPRPVHPRPVPPQVNRKLLPNQCLRTLHTDRGRAHLFTQRCLERHYRHVNSLPDRCHRQVWTDRGWRQGWGARCLNRHGFQMARR